MELRFIIKTTMLIANISVCIMPAVQTIHDGRTKAQEKNGPFSPKGGKVTQALTQHLKSRRKIAESDYIPTALMCPCVIQDQVGRGV